MVTVLIERVTAPFYSGIHNEYRCYGHPTGYGASDFVVKRLPTAGRLAMQGKRRRRRH